MQFGLNYYYNYLTFQIRLKILQKSLYNLQSTTELIIVIIKALLHLQESLCYMFEATILIFNCITNGKQLRTDE